MIDIIDYLHICLMCTVHLQIYTIFIRLYHCQNFYTLTVVFLGTDIFLPPPRHFLPPGHMPSDICPLLK